MSLGDKVETVVLLGSFSAYLYFFVDPLFVKDPIVGLLALFVGLGLVLVWVERD